MTAATAPQSTPDVVKFYCADFGLIEAPALHQLESIGLLFTDTPSQILMDDEITPEFIEHFKGRDENDVARFFQMWVTAGWDFELASWNQTQALYRTLLASEEEPESPPITLRAAEALQDNLEELTTNIIDRWTVLA